jgi:hypothetical protein
VRRKRAPIRPRAQDNTPVDAHLVLRAESLGVRETKLEALINEFGDAAVRDKVDVLERRATNNRLRGVENAHSYLRSLLRHDDAAADGAPAAPGVAEPSLLDRLSRPAVAGQAAGAPATLPAAAATVATAAVVSAADLAGLWLADRIAQVKAELAALDPVQRQPWVDEALADLGRKGLLSAVISRRAAQGDVLHGMLGSVIVRLYASARHGSGWDQPPPPAGGNSV